MSATAPAAAPAAAPVAAESMTLEMTKPVEEEIDDEALQQLWDAVHEGDRASIEALIVGDEEHPPLGCPVDVTGFDGMTPLHWLAVEGHGDVIEWLIDEVGANVNFGDTRNGLTALHFAASKDHARVAEALIQRGADPLATCKAGWTSLHAAARSGSAEVLAVLLHAVPTGSGANVRGPSGHTPLHRAAFWGHTEAVRVLLDAGASRDALDASGRTPMDLICDGNHLCTEVPALQKLLRPKQPVYEDAAAA